MSPARPPEGAHTAALRREGTPVITTPFTWPAAFGHELRQRREELRWSQELLAHKAELNRSYLGEVERGRAVPSLGTMAKLAAALQTPLSTLLANCEQRVPEAR